MGHFLIKRYYRSHYLSFFTSLYPHTHTHTHTHIHYRLTGYSPFQGETHSDTFYNVSMCEYDFEDEVFDDVSQEAKDFIEELLQKKPR